MNYIFIILLSFFAIINGLCAQQIVKPQSRLREAVKTPLHLYRLQHKGKIAGVNVEQITYGYHLKQYLLICRPDSHLTIKKQIVFFIHGGGWHLGKPSQHLLLAQLLNNQGFIVVLPAYRLTPEVTACEMQSDIAEAFLQTQKVFNNKGFTGKNYIIGGASAGANLAALLVYNNDLQQAHHIDSEVFSGFFSLAGALDINQIKPNRILKLYAGKKGSDQFIQSNPAQQIDNQDIVIPNLFIHGEKDGMISLKSARDFAAQLCQLHCDMLTFQTIPKGTHISVGSQWYYQKRKDVLQSHTLVRWLLQRC